VRYGCHCAHLLVKHLVNISPFMEQFQRVLLKLFPKITLPGLTRVSLGIGTSKEDIDTFIYIISKIARQSRTQQYRNSDSTRNGVNILSQKEIQQQMNNFARAVAQRIYD
jgi:hypothetical protein